MAVLDPLWSQVDVCRHSRTVHHRRNKFSSFYHYHQKFELTSNLASAGVGLYQMAVTNPPSQRMCGPNRLDAPILLYGGCRNTVVYASHLLSHHDGSMHSGRILRLWIKVIVESSLLFAAAPVAYIMSDTHTGCPLLVVTMIIVSFSSMCCLPRC